MVPHVYTSIIITSKSIFYSILRKQPKYGYTEVAADPEFFFMFENFYKNFYV